MVIVDYEKDIFAVTFNIKTVYKCHGCELHQDSKFFSE